MDEFDKIVEQIENEYDVIFDSSETMQLFADVVAKCERIGKGKEYLPILFRCELKNKIAADRINLFGAVRKAMKGGCLNG